MDSAKSSMLNGAGGVTRVTDIMSLNIPSGDFSRIVHIKTFSVRLSVLYRLISFFTPAKISSSSEGGQ